MRQEETTPHTGRNHTGYRGFKNQLGTLVDRIMVGSIMVGSIMVGDIMVGGIMHGMETKS